MSESFWVNLESETSDNWGEKKAWTSSKDTKMSHGWSWRRCSASFKSARWSIEFWHILISLIFMTSIVVFQSVVGGELVARLRRKEKKRKFERDSAINHVQIRTNTRVKLQFEVFKSAFDCNHPVSHRAGWRLGILHSANILLLMSLIHLCVSGWRLTFPSLLFRN